MKTMKTISRQYSNRLAPILLNNAFCYGHTRRGLGLWAFLIRLGDFGSVTTIKADNWCVGSRFGIQNLLVHRQADRRSERSG